MNALSALPTTPVPQLTRLDDNLISITLSDTAGAVVRRMTVVQLEDARLVIYGAIALGADDLRKLERHGVPSYLIVSNAADAVDAASWKEQYPDLIVIAPSGLRSNVEPVVPVDQTSGQFGDPRVSFVTIPGTGETRTALVVESETGTTLLLEDLTFAVATDPSKLELASLDRVSLDILALPFQSAKDKESLRFQLLAWSQLEGLQRIICERAVVTEDASHRLIDAAAALA